MIKRSPSVRTPRSRGIKVKQVLQICLLVGVCFWLLYQVKHSHDKKKEFDEKDEKVSLRAQTDDEIPKLGRKDLHPQERASTMSSKHAGDEEDVEEEEMNQEEESKNAQEQEGAKQEEGTKHQGDEREEEDAQDEEERGAKHDEKEEEDIEEETKGEEAEDESRGGGDDEIDERDQEKIGGETDRDEDFVDEDKEVGLEGEEKEGVGNKGEEKAAEVEHDTSGDEHEQDEGIKNAHEAREEHYKADDASSAVTHEPEKETPEILNERATSELEHENNSSSNDSVDSSQNQNNSTFQLGQESSPNSPPLNSTTDKTNEGGIVLSNPKDKSVNSTFTSLSSDQPELTNKSTGVRGEAGNIATAGTIETSGSSQHNDTVTVLDLTQAQNATGDGASTREVPNLAKNGTISASTQSDPDLSTNLNLILPSKTESNQTVGTDTSESSSNTVSDTADKTIKPEARAEGEVKPGSFSTTEVIKEDTHMENTNADNSGGTDESSGSSTTDGTGDSVIHDPIDSSDSSIGQEEREARIDLSTLPDIGMDVINTGNIAEE